MAKNGIARFALSGRAQPITMSGYRYYYVYAFWQVGDTKPSYTLSTTSHASGSTTTGAIQCTGNLFYRNCYAEAATILSGVTDNFTYGSSPSIRMSDVSSVTVNDVEVAHWTDTSDKLCTVGNGGDIANMRRLIHIPNLKEWLQAASDWEVEFKDATTRDVISGMTLTYANEQYYVQYNGNYDGAILMTISPTQGNTTHFVEYAQAIEIEDIYIYAPEITVYDTVA